MFLHVFRPRCQSRLRLQCRVADRRANIAPYRQVLLPGPSSVTQEWVTGRDHVRPSGNGMAFHAVNVRGGVPGRVFRVRPAQRNLIFTRTSNLNLHSPPSDSDGGEFSV